MSSRLVVVGMGAAVHDDRLAGIADAVDATIAHLQIGEPSLNRELGRLADAGATQIVLVGAAFGTVPGNSWLRRVAAHWWRERPDPPEVVVASGLVECSEEIDDVLRRARPITGAEAPLTSSAWEGVPGHRYQVFVCRGPRCTARGSDATAEALGRALARAGLDEDDVLLTQTGCQLPCNQAPVVTVHPDDVWYGQVDDSAARSIVEEHLVAGRPVTERRLARNSGGTRS